MKKHIFSELILCFILNNLLFAQNVDLVGQLNPYPNLDYSDIWGYAAPDGKEYALMGVTGGTVIIDVSDPVKPVEVEFISGPNAPPYEWRDIKTHLNYAYVVTEGSGPGSGMQIIDLSNLPDSASLVNTYNTTFTTAHNLFIDNGYAYVIGTAGVGGMRILDLSDPVKPVETAYYIASGYIHDVYVWNDTVVVCAGSSGQFHLVDVSIKSNPQLISASPSIPGTYAHSGWMTEDKRYFYGTEEFNSVDITVWDLQDRSSWDLILPSWETNSNATVHNLFIQGNYAHVSYYSDGYVVLDITDPESPYLIGQYDTPSLWGCYPYLPSGITICSDMANGLNVFQFDTPTSVKNDDLPTSYSLKQNYPNPFNPATQINFSIPNSEFVNLSIYNSLGEKVSELVNETKPAGEYSVTFDASELSSGIYFAKITAGSFLELIKMALLK